MSGNRYILDTNAVISLLGGNQKLVALLTEAVWVGMSVINKLEFLSFPTISKNDIFLFDSLLTNVDVIPVSDKDSQLIDEIIKLRSVKNLKLPDAIIAATAIKYDATLISGDKSFQSVKELEIVIP